MQYLILFLEGIITFVSPCLLPMIPVYASYFAGGEGSRKKTFIGALGFVLGFTAVFVLLGALAGTLGGFLKRYQTAVNIVTGGIVILFGLNFLGAFKLNIFRGGRGRSGAKGGGFFASMLFGIVFSVGWTPCVGAFLGSALMIVASQGRVLEGMLMLLCYSVGLGVPFVLGAVLIDRLKSAFDFIKKHYRVINIISGLFLVLIGVLMATGLFGRWIALLS